MKPENYSLKFQNSLANSKITPGSQHGKAPDASVKTRNGLRAARKPTKAQLGVSKKRKLKMIALNRNLKAEEEVDGVLMRKEEYARRRALEKAVEAKCGETLKGILKTKNSVSQEVGAQNEDSGKRLGSN